MNETASPPILTANKVRKVFRKRNAPPIEVLKQVDLQVRAGESIAIVGKSGAGKSTLLHILGTLEKPTEGDVYFLGQNIFTFNEEKLSRFRNRQVGFVFQFHYLMLEFTALENTMMPALINGESRRTARERAEALLIKVGLQGRMDHKPNQLSGGEQQRVAIARALMMNPKLLLTDEMTGNLDPLTGASVFELVHSVFAEFQMALISVTHDELLASAYQKVYRLVDGQLVLDPMPASGH